MQALAREANMEGQEPTETQEPVTEQASVDTTPPTDAQGAPREQQDRLHKLEMENTKLRQESASRRVKAKEADESRKVALEENNQFRELSEHLKSQLTQTEEEIARLQSYEASAKRWAAHEELETARIAEQVQMLPDGLQSAVLSITDLGARATALSAFLDHSQGGQTKPPPSASPTAPTHKVDFAAAGGDKAALRELINSYPDQWKQYIGSSRGPGSSGFLDRVLAKGK